MNDKKLIASALLEIAKRSTTTFLEVGKEDKELINAAKKIGIVLPSPDLMVMKTVYAEIDKVNKNGVTLPKKAVEKGLSTLVGKQCNWEHDGAGFVCGYTISAKINGDEIETINVLFKSLFPEQSEDLKEKVKSGEAAVSFEIWNKNPETGESVIKQLENGNREINPIIFHGTGVLLTHKPACPSAKIFKLIATNLTETARKVMQKTFSPDLIYASLALEETEYSAYDCECLKCGKIISSEKHCKDIKCPECGGSMRRKDRPGKGQPTEKSNSVKIITEKIDVQKLICPHCENAIGEKELFYDEQTQKWYHRPCKESGEIILPKEHKKEEKIIMIKCEKCGKDFEASAEEKLCAECASLPKEEKTNSSEETKPEATPEETKPENTEEIKPAGAETKPEDTQGKETKEEAQPLEQITPKVVVKVTRIYSDEYVDTYVDGTMSGTSEGKSYAKTITEYSDGTKDEVTAESEYKKKYDFAELEAAVNKAKEELINLHKAELEAKTNEVKTDLEKKINEKETEIANLKTELEKKTQEKASETKPEGSQASLEVGSVEEIESAEKKEIADRKKSIDDIIAGKHNR